jgi:hypothetical protein
MDALSDVLPMRNESSAPQQHPRTCFYAGVGELLI